MYYLWCKQNKIMNYEINSIEKHEDRVTVETTFGENCTATFNLSNAFIKKHVSENGLNKFEPEYGSGVEDSHDIDTYINEELQSVVEHILAENE